MIAITVVVQYRVMMGCQRPILSKVMGLTSGKVHFCCKGPEILSDPRYFMQDKVVSLPPPFRGGGEIITVIFYSLAR